MLELLLLVNHSLPSFDCFVLVVVAHEQTRIHCQSNAPKRVHNFLDAVQGLVLFLLNFADHLLFILVKRERLFDVFEGSLPFMHVFNQLIILLVFDGDGSVFNVADLLQVLFDSQSDAVPDLLASAELHDELCSRYVALGHFAVPRRHHHLVLQVGGVRLHRPGHELVEQAVGVQFLESGLELWVLFFPDFGTCLGTELFLS